MYRYFLTSRPPSIGCQPRGTVRIFGYGERRNGYWGWADYKEPLTEDQIAEYELEPAADWVKVVDWRDMLGKPVRLHLAGGTVAGTIDDYNADCTYVWIATADGEHCLDALNRQDMELLEFS